MVAWRYTAQLSGVYIVAHTHSCWVTNTTPPPSSLFSCSSSSSSTPRGRISWEEPVGASSAPAVYGERTQHGLLKLSLHVSVEMLNSKREEAGVSVMRGSAGSQVHSFVLCLAEATQSINDQSINYSSHSSSFPLTAVGVCCVNMQHMSRVASVEVISGVQQCAGFN